MNSRANSTISSQVIAKPKKYCRNVNPDLSLSKGKKKIDVRNCELRKANTWEDGEHQEATMSMYHADLLADVAYACLTGRLVPSGELLDEAFKAGSDLQKQLRPRDALERLSVTQIQLALGRVSFLTALLARETEPGAIAKISQAVERATGSCERLMREYRKREGAKET